METAVARIPDASAGLHGKETRALHCHVQIVPGRVKRTRTHVHLTSAQNPKSVYCLIERAENFIALRCGESPVKWRLRLETRRRSIGQVAGHNIERLHPGRKPGISDIETAVHECLSREEIEQSSGQHAENPELASSVNWRG